MLHNQELRAGAAQQASANKGSEPKAFTLLLEQICDF
jgi:hypothetical protein